MHDTWKSKKLWFSVGVIAIAFIYAVLSATYIPNLGAMYDSFTGILEFIAGAYLTGNVANKFVVGKASSAAIESAPKPAAKAPAKAPPGGPKPPDEDD